MSALLSLAPVQALFSLLGEENVRLVGGCVRDDLLGLPIHDLDACTCLTPDQVVDCAAESDDFTAYPTGLDHGTVTLVYGDDRQVIEVTTLRTDVVTYGRRAEVVFGTSWEEDAARRDFTFNALMLDADSRVHDFFEGQQDLREGQVRFIGNPMDRLSEDWLRALRYFRFWARFGRVNPTTEEEEALGYARGHLSLLSVERIWSELKGLVMAPGAKEALYLFQKLGFLEALGLRIRPAQFSGLDPVSAWAGLLTEENSDFIKRMRGSKVEQERFAAVQAALLSDEPLPATQMRHGHEAVKAAEILSGRSGHVPKAPEFPITARDILNLGYQPGPEIGQLLHDLKEKWIISNCQLSKTDLLDDLTKSST